MLLTAIIAFIFVATMLMAAIRDASTMTIPNWISLVLLGAFVLCVPFAWQGWPTLSEHIAVGITVFAIGFIMFALGWFGGGDAKLMAATAIWWTWPDLMLYLVYTTVAGGVLGVLILLCRKFLPARIITSSWVYRLLKDETKMPYGLALAFGALTTLPQSDIFKFAAGIG
ncbi:MAG: A24 family peptidase [Maricaulaceae bacterium]